MQITRRLTRPQSQFEFIPKTIKSKLLPPDQGNRTTPLGTGAAVTERPDELALKVNTNGQKWTCQANPQNWKAVHKAGQQQQ